jgi:hypothetical protein
LKRVLAAAVLLLGIAGAFATPASAETACVNLHLDVNGTVQDVNQCV